MLFDQSKAATSGSNNGNNKSFCCSVFGVIFRRQIMQILARVCLTLAIFACIVSFYSNSRKGLGNCTKEFCENPSQKSTFFQISFGRTDSSQLLAEQVQDSLISAIKTNDNEEDTVHIAVVACGDRLEETLMMLKSAVILGQTPIFAHIFADEELRPMFKRSLLEWRKVVKWRPFDFSLYPISFPPGTEKQWKNLFKPCACQRLFIPDILSNLTAVLYVDTDILFLRPPEMVWKHFGRMNASHMAALAPESEDHQTNWYVRFGRHPFVKPLGVNTGVMLLNLTRMRDFQWGTYLWPLYTKYRYNITWGDQDIINIIFHNNTDKLYIYGCEWNYRPDHCMYMSTCKKAEELGAYVLHGSRSYFHKEDKQPAFRAVYLAFKSYSFGKSLDKYLVTPLEETLKTMNKSTNCAKVHWIFTRQLRKYVTNIKT